MFHTFFDSHIVEIFISGDISDPLNQKSSIIYDLLIHEHFQTDSALSIVYFMDYLLVCRLQIGKTSDELDKVPGYLLYQTFKFLASFPVFRSIYRKLE